MALITTIADATADSYVSLSEMDEYISGRSARMAQEWLSLSSHEQEDRLRLAANVIDALPLRGIRATTTQARAFPRIFPGSALWPSSSNASLTDEPRARCASWEDVVALAASLDIDPPTIPDAVKRAQMEAAFLYAHYLYNLDSSEQGEETAGRVTQVQSGDLFVTLSTNTGGLTKAGRAFLRESLGPDSLVWFIMKPYVTRMRGFIV